MKMKMKMKMKMNEWLLFNIKREHFQLYYGKNRLYLMRDEDVYIVIDQHVEVDFYSVNYLGLHLNILSWLCANQSMLVLLNAACLA